MSKLDYEKAVKDAGLPVDPTDTPTLRGMRKAMEEAI